MALWALVPVALHVSSECTGTGALHKTQARVLGFANAYSTARRCRPLGARPRTRLARCTAERTDIPRARDRRAVRALVDAARDARALQASFATDPACAIARLQQGASMAQVVREQGPAPVSLDEVVPLALLA